MPSAPVDHQRRLLDVQDCDLRAQQARHRRSSLPAHAVIEELTARAADLDQERLARSVEVLDLARAVSKAEDDVDAVRARARRDEERLSSGQGTPKDLQALQSELEVLGRRQGALEEVELEIMQRLEDAQAAKTAAAAQVAEITEHVTRVTAERDAETALIDEELASIAVEREAAIAGLDGTLVALYERLRDQHGGIGAAALLRGQCQGCHMSLNPADLAAIEVTAAESIVRCEECGRILVRESTA